MTTNFIPALLLAIKADMINVILISKIARRRVAKEYTMNNEMNIECILLDAEIGALSNALDNIKEELKKLK